MNSKWLPSKADPVFVFLLLLVLALVVRCGGQPGETSKPANTPETPSVEPTKDPDVDKPTVVEVDDTRSGGSVVLSPGAVLVVRLETQPGTGYGWRVASPKLDILETAAEPQIESAQPDRPGGVERHRFEFRAKKSGTEELVLEYVRPWERDAKPARTFTLRVEVRP